MKFPKTILTPAGEEIPLRMADLKGKGLGYWSLTKKEIVIEDNQPDAGKLVILVHEMLHLIDDQLVAAGALKRRTQHGFIHNSALPLVGLLSLNGFLRLSPEEFGEFLSLLKAEHGEEEE